MKFSIKFMIFLFSCIPTIFCQLWNATNYPNPLKNFTLCNIKSSSFLCDPDSVLTDDQRDALNSVLNQLEVSTYKSSGNNYCDKQGITGVIALAKQIQGGTEQDASNMANGLLRAWNLDPQCQKDLVMVVSIEDKKFWGAEGVHAPITGQDITKIFDSQKTLFATQEYSQALINILNSIVDLVHNKKQENFVPTWLIIVIILISFVLMIFVCYDDVRKNEKRSTSGTESGSNFWATNNSTYVYYWSSGGDYGGSGGDCGDGGGGGSW